MKKVVLFLLFLVVCAMVSMQPVVDAPAAASHPLPVWPILCYLAVVLLLAVVTAWKITGKRTEEKINIHRLNHEPGT